MPFAALGVLKDLIPWKLVAVIGLGLGLFFGMVYVVGKIRASGMYQAQRDTAIEASRANAQIAKWQTDESTRLQDIVSENARVKIVTRKASDQTRRKITDAPLTDDGPLARVLRDELDRLPGTGTLGGEGNAAPISPSSASPPAALRGPVKTRP